MEATINHRRGEIYLYVDQGKITMALRAGVITVAASMEPEAAQELCEQLWRLYSLRIERKGPTAQELQAIQDREGKTHGRPDEIHVIDNEPFSEG